MSTESKRKIPAPFIAIAVLVVAWGAFTFWPSPDDDAPSVDEPTPQPVTEGPAPVFEETTPGTYVSGATPPPIVDGDGEGEWSTYHGGPSLTGMANVDLPDAPVALWRFQADNSVYHTPVTCGGNIFFTTFKGGIYALDLEGKEVWSKQMIREIREDGTPRLHRFDAPASCFESTVLVGTMSGALFAFDAATGEEKWTYDVGGPVLGSVNLLDSDPLTVAVISQEDGSVHSIDLAKGEQVWRTESIDRCDGSPSIHNGEIIFGSCAAALHVFSTSDGELLRNIELDPDSQVAGGVALAGDSAFTGSHSGRVFHINSATGEIIWINQSAEDEIISTPAVRGNFVVFTAYDGRIYALDRNSGQEKWRFETDGWPHSPVIAGDKVVADADGLLYLLDLETGKEIWSYEVSDEISSPAIINGMIVVGSEDGTVTAFGAPRT